MLHSSAVSVLFKEELKAVEAVEGGTATLRCQLGTEAPVEWRKGQTLLRASSKYKMRQEGTVAELLIHDLEPKDAGDYSCLVGNQKTTAALSVNGKKAEITCETLECFCPPLPPPLCTFPHNNLLHVLLSVLSSIHFLVSLLSPISTLNQLLLYPMLDVCVCVVLSSYLPLSEGCCPARVFS